MNIFESFVENNHIKYTRKIEVYYIGVRKRLFYYKTEQDMVTRLNDAYQYNLTNKIGLNES